MSTSSGCTQASGPRGDAVREAYREFSAALRRRGKVGEGGLFRVLAGGLDSEEQLVPFVMLAGWRRASAGEGLIE
jgi:hypothetical protein